jgi:hypothetical protein
MACRLAASPTARLAVLAESHERGGRAGASRFGITRGDAPSMTAIREWVAPRSTPIIRPTTAHLSTHLPPRQSIRRTRACRR